jgi:hypothetical protein
MDLILFSRNRVAKPEAVSIDRHVAENLKAKKFPIRAAEPRLRIEPGARAPGRNSKTPVGCRDSGGQMPRKHDRPGSLKPFLERRGPLPRKGCLLMAECGLLNFAQKHENPALGWVSLKGVARNAVPVSQL